jgi:golgi-specific brefeldin A-resistance guanine nucleotide exchange factor 1
LTALSFIFDKSLESLVHAKSLRGFNKSAAIAAHYNLHEDFDALVLSLCKFTMLLNVAEDAIDLSTSVMFAQSTKAQLAMKCVFGLLHENGDCMRESWKHTLDVIIQLFKMRLLPKVLMEAEDFCEVNGKVTLIRQPPQLPKVDSGIFSSLYSYLSSDSQRQPSYEEQEMIKMAKRCIRECQIDQIINESKFLQFESLQELIKSILVLLRPPEAHKSVGIYYPEDITVFLLELLIKILIQNRDRVMPVWLTCRDQIYLLLMGATTCDYEYLLHRTTIGLLKLAIYLMRNEELCPVVLQSLKMFLMLKPNTIFKISRHISTGMYELLKTR